MSKPIRTETECPQCSIIITKYNANDTDKQIICTWGCYHSNIPTTESDIVDIINKVGYYASKLTQEVSTGYSDAAKDYLTEAISKHKIILKATLVQYFDWLDNNITRGIEHTNQYNERYSCTQVYDEYGISREHYDILKKCAISKEQLFADVSRDALIIQDLYNKDKALDELHAAFYNMDADNYVKTLQNEILALEDKRYKAAYIGLVKHILTGEKFTNFIDLKTHNENTYRKKLLFAKVVLNILSQEQKAQPKFHFSALQWATIFYYADEAKLLPPAKSKVSRIQSFMTKHQIDTTPKNMKSKYYEAMKKINKTTDYPIRKLEDIKPFLNEHYPKTVTKIENDIIFLKNNDIDY